MGFIVRYDNATDPAPVELAFGNAVDAKQWADDNTEKGPEVFETSERLVYKPEMVSKGGAQREALALVLAVLDGWIKGQRANHDALDHGTHRLSEECWNTWNSADLRSMVNDAALELNLGPLFYAEKDHRK